MLTFSSNLLAQNQLKNFLPESCYQTGEFKQEKTLPSIEQPLVAQGRFAFSCDKGLVWRTQTPLDETTVYRMDGKIWLISEDAQAQELKSKVHRQMGKLLNQLMGGNQRFLEKMFSIRFADGGVELIPKQSRMKKFLQVIDIAKNEQEVVITMRQADQQTMTISVSNIQNPASLDEQVCREATQTPALVCQKLL